MKFKIFSIILALIFTITGCATIVSGTTQEVTFQSSPEDATVKVNGRPIGKTPLTVQLDKKADQVLTVEKEGYKTFSTTMTTTMDGWFFGNIILGGLLGSTTDGMSGAMNEYAPSQYIITLEAEAVTKLESNTTLSKRENARRFLILNYDKLKSDLSKSTGETLDTALFLLNVKSEERASAVSKIKDLMFSNNDPIDFVNVTLNDYFAPVKTAQF